MNKRLLATAVTTAISAPAALAGDVSIYGEAHVATSMYSSDMIAASNTGEGWDLSTHESHIGFKGSEDLGNGLKAIWQMELLMEITDTDAAQNNGDPGATTYRNSFVGLASPWGTLLAGRHDTPLNIATADLDIFSETIADYNANGADDALTGAGNMTAFTPAAAVTSVPMLAGQGLGFVDITADNAIAYVSPTWKGLTLIGAIVQPGMDTTAVGTDADGFAEAYSVAGLYSNGPFFATVAYEKINESYVEEMIATAAAALPLLGDDERWRAGLGYTANGIHVGFVYEDQEHPLVGVDASRWQVSGSYAFGNNVIKAMYGEHDVDVSNAGATALTTAGVTLPDGTAITALYGGYDVAQWAIGLDHNFSERTLAYVVYTDVDVDQGLQPAVAVSEADWSGLSIGLRHTF